MNTQPYLPEGIYQIARSFEQAEVFYLSYQYSSELRVRWLPEDAGHRPLNNLLAHISVMELDRLAQAAANGAAFAVAKLTDIVPRPGWDIETCAADNPAQYALQQKNESVIHRGPRRELLLLLELAVRSAIAPHIGQPPPRSWVQRLRDVHPQLLTALGEEAVFEKQDTDTRSSNIRLSPSAI